MPATPQVDHAHLALGRAEMKEVHRLLSVGPDFVFGTEGHVEALAAPLGRGVAVCE